MNKAISLFIFWILLLAGITSAQEPPARVTILYDAFGKPSTLKRGWGYSALVEYGGKRVLFDTGGDTDDFAYNVKTLSIDLTRLDFVILTHRHGDHTSGLSYVLSLNPGVKIYTPVDTAVFGRGGQVGALGKLIQRKVDSVPEDLRYFSGNPPVDSAVAFRDKWKIERMSPGHCTGQFAFSEFIRIYGSKFDQAGVGSVTTLPL